MPKGVHNSRRGPKTQFHPTFVTTAFEQCLLGHQDERIAELFGIHIQTLERWKRQFPAFAKAFIRGRDTADGKVAKALYRRALGFSHATEKLTYDTGGNIVERKRFTNYFPPSESALAFYLGNRSRALWQTKGNNGLTVNLGLESLIAEVVKARDERAAKVIEHQPAESETDK
jgi:hypothetical protein